MRKQSLKYRVIYAIKCLPTGKMYVGSAEKYWNRYYTHIGALNRNTHANDYLQKAWNKYGRECFLFAVIEEISDTDSIADKEQYWMDFFNVCDKSKGFNIYPKARTSLGFKYSQHSREKMSESRMGIVFTDAHIENMKLAKVNNHPMSGRIGKLHTRSKPINQYSLNGELIKEWESGNQCAVSLGLHKSGLIMCLKNRISQTKGFVFRYK